MITMMTRFANQYAINYKLDFALLLQALLAIPRTVLKVHNNLLAPLYLSPVVLVAEAVAKAHHQHQAWVSSMDLLLRAL
jgi:hypothetical protein